MGKEIEQPNAIAALSKDTQHRKYHLTENNPLKDPDNPLDHQEIRKRMEKLTTVVYWCMADEKGLEEETHHTHIYFVSHSPIRFSSVKSLFPTAHIEPAYGDSAANRDYISKSGKWAKTKGETSIEGTFEEWGEIPNNERMGAKGELHFIFAMVDNGMTTAQIIRAFPEAIRYLDKVEHTRQIIVEEEYQDTWRDLEVTYIYGVTETGKTRSVMERYGYGNIHRITDYAHPWDSYQATKHQVVVFEEFRSSLKIQDMLNYLDGYPCELIARYRNKVATYLGVYIITNVPLEQQYENIQRESPRTWKAFIRRIGKVQHFLDDGTIITFDSVEDYFNRDSTFEPVTEQLQIPFEED